MGDNYRYQRLMPDCAFVCYSKARRGCSKKKLSSDERDYAIEALANLSLLYLKI